MIALAFLLSCFFTSAKTATVFAYLVVFGTGLIGSLLLTQLINAGQWYTTLLQLVPSFALFRCSLCVCVVVVCSISLPTLHAQALRDGWLPRHPATLLPTPPWF